MSSLQHGTTNKIHKKLSENKKKRPTPPPLASLAVALGPAVWFKRASRASSRTAKASASKCSVLAWLVLSSVGVTHPLDHPLDHAGSDQDRG